MNKQAVSEEYEYDLTLEKTFNYNSLYKLRRKNTKEIQFKFMIKYPHINTHMRSVQRKSNYC